jgi:tRNA G46 methylase TrmB
MQSQSRKVTSSQLGPHSSLLSRVDRHRKHPWQKPLASHTRRVFEILSREIDGREPLVLDSGCGTGESSRSLARCFPGHRVIGIDQSAHRLESVGSEGAVRLDGNLALVRAELADFWRLALSAGWQLEHHYLLYPNPWPKPGHLARRWHAHPVFPTLLALRGRLELRTNWKVYADEFSLAVAHCGFPAEAPGLIAAADPLTPFEKKYAASDHDLWQVRVDLSALRSNS